MQVRPDTLNKLIRAIVGDDHWQDWTGYGLRNDSGVPVNRDTALTYAYVWAALDLVSADVARLPFNDTEIDENGDRQVQFGSNVQWLLNDEPNEMMTSYNFRRTLQSHAMLQGNGYAAIQRDLSNRPVRLVPIDPRHVQQIWRDEATGLWYQIQGLEDPLPGRDMLHIIGLSDNGVVGHSVITKARNSFGLGLAAEQHGNSHFKNGASPKVVLKTERRLDEAEAQQLLDSWNANQAGSENAGKTGLAHGGLDIASLPISNEDAQWLESRKFQLNEVAAWFGIPSVLLGSKEGLAYSSVVAENQAYLRRLGKWLEAWESECRRKLYNERTRRGGRRRLIHDPTELLRTDPETQSKIASDLVSSEIITRNEGRRRMGYNRNESPIADVLSSPNTRTDNSAPVSVEEPGSEAVAAHRRLFRDRMTKLIKSEVKSVENAVKRTKDFVGWLDKFYAKRPGDMASELEPILAAYASLPGAEVACTADDISAEYSNYSKHLLLEAAGASYPDNLATTVAECTETWLIRAEHATDSVLIGTAK